VGLLHGPPRPGGRLLGPDQEAAEPLELVGPQQADGERRGDGGGAEERDQEARRQPTDDQHRQRESQ
jgi:hypothetical protein